MSGSPDEKGWPGGTIDAVLASSQDSECRHLAAIWRLQFRSGLVAALAAAAVLSISGCSRPITQWELFDDPLVGETVDGHDGTTVLEECSCADETYAALRWSEGRTSFEADLAWEMHPQLVLAGCLECTDDGRTGVPGRLEWSVRTALGEFGGEISLADVQGWWRHTSALDVGPGRGTVSIVSEVPQGCTLFLRDVHVRSREAWRGTRQRPTQILLISVDTLRHDVIEPAGPATSTPRLARFAREAEVWPIHYAGASWTLASHATMLTGYPSWVHMAYRKDAVIDASVPTLAERLSSIGFATGAMVFDCGWLAPERGFARGFNGYRVERWRIERQAREVLGWIRDHREQPFFYFFHSFEPHSDSDHLPYEAPGVSRRTVRELFSVDDYGCRRGRCASLMLRGINQGIVPVRPYDALILRHLYDAGVRHTDAALGELFDALREAGIWDNLVVVVTSDHGEAFLEHERVGHSSLHEEVIRVPLLVKWAYGERAGMENPLRSSSIDLAPTLLELSGIDATDLPGSHLHRLDPERPVVAGDFAKTVVVGDLKGIFGGPRKHNEVYHLGLDPGETDNLLGRNNRLRNRLVRLLQQRVKRDRRYLEGDGAAAKVERLQLTPEEEERLRVLGYVD